MAKQTTAPGKKGEAKGLDGIYKKVREMKAEMLILNIAIAVLGCVMIIIPDEFNRFMGQILGVGLIVWGVLRCISFLRLKGEDMFGSFALVQGAGMLGFGIFFLVKPNSFGELLNVALAIIVMLIAVLKIQNAINYMKLKIRNWWIHLILAVLLLAFGVVALVRPEGMAAKTLLILIGVSFVVSAVWDIVSILFMSKVIKRAAKTAETQSKLVNTTAETKKNKKTEAKNKKTETVSFDDDFGDDFDDIDKIDK